MLCSGVPELQPPPKKQTMQGRWSVFDQSFGFTTKRRNSVSPTLRKMNASLPGIETGVTSGAFADEAAVVDGAAWS